MGKTTPKGINSDNGPFDATVPDGWDCSSMAAEVAFTRKPREVEISPETPVPFIPMELLPDSDMIASHWEMRSGSKLTSGVFFNEGDILLAKITPCLQNGKQGIVRGIPGGWGFATTEVYAFRSIRLDRDYLAFYLKVPGVRRWLASRLQGATGRQRLPREALESLWIPVPPLPEQRAIAQVLRTVQRAKEATEKVLAATKQLKQSLLRHLFTYGPVPFDQADRVELKETESGEVPATWVTKRFDEFATLQRGKDLPRWEFKGGAVPVIGATSVIGYHDTANVKGPGVTVVRSGSSVGKPLYVDRDFWAHNVVLYVKDFHGNNPKFVFYRLLTLGLEQFRAGVAVPTLNRNSFSGMQVAVPCLPEQRKIAATFTAVGGKMVAEESRHRALTTLFNTLLDHLMTGKVRVHDLGFATGTEGTR